MSFLGMKKRGNEARIMELHEIGLRPDAIVEKFNQHGIKITTVSVEYVISGEAAEMDRVSLPRQVVKDLKDEVDSLAAGLEA